MDLEAIEVENQVVEAVGSADNSVAHSLMEQQIVISQAQAEAVQQVDSQGASELQVEPEVHIQLQPEFQTEVQVLNLPQHGASMASLGQAIGHKRVAEDESMLDSSSLPRKKTRVNTYLDSHKVIEKKRRDRINQCLNSIKSLIPDCRQYGNKKLDKAEILEMTIEYLQRLQQQVPDLPQAQRDWANEIMTWVMQNKLHYSGPNAMDQFCNNLMLHLQNYGTQSTANANLQNIASVLLSQANDEGEANELYRQLMAHHMQQRAQEAKGEEQEAMSPSPKAAGDDDPQQKEQKEQMQTIQSILLQQIIQQQLQQQQGGIESGINLQQLQMLIAQQLSTQDSAGKQSSVQQLLSTLQQLQQLSQKHGLQLIQGQEDDEGTPQTPQGISITTVFSGHGDSESEAVELSLSTDQAPDEVTSATEESVYTSSIEGLPENLLNTQTPTSVQGVEMWSGDGHTQDSATENRDGSSLLMLPTEGDKTQPDLLSHQEQ